VVATQGVQSEHIVQAFALELAMHEHL
jgi:hypothetical protein